MSKRMTGERTRESWLIGVMVAVAALIFIVDLSIELGVAVGVAYVAVMIPAFRSERPGLVRAAAFGCSTLVLVGAYKSPMGGLFWRVVANRSLSLAAIWATAFLCRARQAERRKAEGLNRSLEEQRRRLAESLGELVTAREEQDRRTKALLSVLEDLGAERERLGKEVEERRRVEAEQQRDRILLETIHRAQTQFLTSENPLGIFGEFLDSLLTLSGSEFGFIDEMFSTPDGQPYLIARAITDIAWDDESRLIYRQVLDGTRHFDNPKSLYGEVMTTARPLIANDAVHDQRRTGIPPGHPPLRTFLGLPLLSSSKEFVGVIGLANCPGGYHEDLVAYLEPMMVACANLIGARKNDQRRQQAERDLRRAHADLEVRVQERAAELHASKERLDLALSSSGVGTWDWRIGENAITWDEHMHPLFGLPPGTFPGTYEAFDRTLIPEDRDRVNEEVRLAVEEGAEYHSEFRIIWPDDTIHSIGARGKVYRDEAGRPVQMTGVCWDLTEQKQTEERFRLVVEAIPNGILMVGGDGTIALANPQVETMFGYSRRELIGLPVEILVPVRDRAAHPGKRSDFFASSRARTVAEGCELFGLRKDGGEVPVEIGLNPIETASGRYVLAILIDITARKKADEDLQRLATELSRSNTELEQFAYIASHDLQEPLRKIQTFGDMLLTETGDALNENARLYLDRMRDASRRMQILINDLLSYARVTSQARPFVDVDLARIAAEVACDLEGRLQSSGGHLDIGGLPHVASDATQMRQLLQNLIGNALKFHRHDEPPVVAIRTRLVDEDGETRVPEDDPVACELTVSDNGIGFEEKYLDRIFAPFQRLHGRGQYEGTGMGLAICRKIAERHGGTITARSVPGRGTTFIVTLPLRQPKEDLPHA